MKEREAFDVILPFPIGPLGFKFTEGKLSSIQFLPHGKALHPALEKDLQPVLTELKAYFANPHHSFTLTLQPQGTPFQQAVWKALRKIPCGETRTYKALAQELKTSPRAVGNACRRNPLPLFIPCHRVIATQGLGGFCGESKGEFMQVKKALLKWEQS